MLIIDKIFYFLLLFVFIKSVTIGSTFNFYLWFKYGRKYWEWYSKNILDAKFDA